MKLLGPSHKAQFPLIVGGVLLLICAAVAALLLWQQRDAEVWLRHTFEVESRLSKVQIYGARAELSRRKYMLTGDLKSLEGYRAARHLLVPELDALVDLVDDNRLQERRAKS